MHCALCTLYIPFIILAHCESFRFVENTTLELNWQKKRMIIQWFFVKMKIYVRIFSSWPRIIAFEISIIILFCQLISSVVFYTNLNLLFSKIIRRSFHDQRGFLTSSRKFKFELYSSYYNANLNFPETREKSHMIMYFLFTFK